MSSVNKHPNASSKSDKLLGQSLKILKKIEIQIVRFHKMPPEEKIKYFKSHRFSNFCTLKTPGGVEILHGDEGERRFEDLCKLLVEFSPRIEGRASYSIVKGSVKSAFYEVFVLAREQMTREGAAKMLESAVVKVESKFKVYEHHIPCVFFTEKSPDVFEIGPVRFTKTEVFLSGVANELKRQAEKTIEKNQFSHTYHERAVSYYQEFPWVASVKVEQFDFDTSLENAVFNCDTALNVVRVIFGRDKTKWVRLSTSQGEALRAARIWTEDNEDARCSLSARVGAPSGPLNWFDFLNSGAGDNIKTFLGHVIEYSRVFEPHSELSSRLLDAINWFGDACLEKSPAAAIVKYVTCIERLYFGSQYQGMKSKFASRVSKVLTDFECEGAVGSLESATEIYNVRSTLVHGVVSQRLGDEPWPLYTAENLARQCILCAEQIYMVIFHAFEPATFREFESALVEYEQKGLDWCIGKARDNKK